DAKSVRTESAPASSLPPAISREYVFLQGPPPPEPAPDKVTIRPLSTGQGAAAQPALSPQSAAPTTPSQNVIPPQSTLQPLQPPDPKVAEPPPVSPSDIATAEIQVPSTSLPVDRSGGTRVSYTRSPRWLRPAVITALMVALLAGAWVGLRWFL